MSSSTAVTKVDLEQYGLKKIASGKVREIFEIDEKRLLFVATDRISAYDVILDNVSCATRCGYLHTIAGRSQYIATPAPHASFIMSLSDFFS